jgi:Tfp pilus assembly protein PilN
MLTTNLLPQKEQKAVRLEKIRRTVIFFTIGIAAILSIGIILLIPSYLLIFIEQQESERSRILEEQASDDTNASEIFSQVQMANRVKKSLQKISQKTSKASLIADNIFIHTSPALVVQQLDIQNQGAITIRGRANTRRDLLAFEQLIRESGLFQDISSPLSNIIRDVDITFNIEGQLQKEYRL